MTRDLMVAELKKVKPFYNYDRYRDDQIFRMYQRYVIDKVPAKDIVTQQEMPVNTPVEKSIEDYEKEYEDQVGYKTCNSCGTRLNDMGTCPECFRGEEGLKESLYNPNCTYVAKECSYEIAHEIAQIAKKALKLPVHEVEMLEHDINNLRANEWVDSFSKLSDNSTAKQMFFQYAVKPEELDDLNEETMTPYERTTNKVLAYAKKDPERVLLYDNMVEYLDELSMEGVFNIPKSAPGFECEDVENVSDEEALFYFEQVLANTDLENKLHELSKTGGNGHPGELEEDFEVEEHEEDFETDIDDIDDDYTDSVTEDAECVICGDIIERYGNNAEPVAKGFCCDKCNREKVIPARLRMYLDK